MSKIVACIPARYGSYRLPGKPLLDIYGKSMIRRTYEQVKKCKNIEDIIILTDSKIIYEHVLTFNAKCIIIREDCLNGTERICHALSKIPNEYNYIINIHGDEPFINHLNIEKCISNFLLKEKTNNLIKSGTFHYKMLNENDIINPSKGKIVLDKNNNILYASRNPIPINKYGKIDNNHSYFSPSGVFIYNRDFLKIYMDENTPCQLVEDIEWLKILEKGYKINTIIVSESEKSIDTEEDYKYILDKYKYLFN